MSHNILDEIEPEFTPDIERVELKAKELLRKAKKAAFFTFIATGVFLLSCGIDAFRVESLKFILPLMPLSAIAAFFLLIVSFFAAYRYGEQASILSKHINKHKELNQYFYRFLHCLFVLVLMVLGWKFFKSYTPIELVWAQFDGNEQIATTAGWWRPYRNLITLLFVGATPFLGLCMILFLCLHTHEKTLSFNTADKISEVKLKSLLSYLSILVLTVITITIIENSYSLRRIYRTAARFFELRREEVSLCLIVFFVVLFVAQWILYVRKPQHL